MKKTAKDKIIEFLSLCDDPMPIHQIAVAGVSQTSISARLRELRRQNRVVKTKVPGVAYDFWSLAPVSDYDFNTKA